MPRADRIQHWTDYLNGFVEYGILLTTTEVEARVEPEEDEDAVLDARIQKAVLTLVKERLDAAPQINRRFKPTTDWKILNQLLTIARVKELTSVRIVKRGRSSGVGYDVEDLSRTYYGRQVLDGLGFTKRRKTLDKTEFEKVKLEFQKIKLTLPEAVEPTTTEKFFALDVAP